jgi:deoxyribodipyrimidine photo-lyase
MRVALHWFRRDLRLQDNRALAKAQADADLVLPVYVFDDKWIENNFRAAPRIAFLLESLKALAHDLEELGSKLFLFHGRPEAELAVVMRGVGAQALYFNRDEEPAGRERDARVEKHLRSAGFEVHNVPDSSIQDPESILKADGTAYTKFTPYLQNWQTRTRPKPVGRAKLAGLRQIKVPTSAILPTLPDLGLRLEIPVIPAGEKAARDQLKHFCRTGLSEYARNRDFPARDLTSRLSPHLTWGTISARTVLAEVASGVSDSAGAGSGVGVFLSELVWRDFYRQIVWHFPHVAVSSFQPAFNDLAWENNDKHFAAWCEGRTGYPIVDAAMRQLNQTGWMHNRLRMIVASFLTKDLLISWQWGERYFMEKLYDGDLAANNGGWQWSAGTGTDAQPYFRIFNPMTQAQKFDPEGEFIRRYVPEIETRDYPRPIVDHAQQRLKAMAMYRKA